MRKAEYKNIPTNIISAVENKIIKSDFRFIVTPIGNFFLVEGQRLPADYINALYPTDVLELRGVKGPLIGKGNLFH